MSSRPSLAPLRPWLPWALKLGCPPLLMAFSWMARPTAFSAEASSLAVAMVLRTLGKRRLTILNLTLLWVMASGLGWALAGGVHLAAPGADHAWFHAYLGAQALMVATQDVREAEP